MVGGFGLGGRETGWGGVAYTSAVCGGADGGFGCVVCRHGGWFVCL